MSMPKGGRKGRWYSPSSTSVASSQSRGAASGEHITVPSPTHTSLSYGASSSTHPHSDDTYERLTYSEVSSPYPDRVSTPWVRNVSMADGNIPLGDEIMCFAQFLSPTADEQDTTNGYRRYVQQVVARYCGHATVKLVGSHAVGVGLPSSGIDLVVESWTGDDEKLGSVLQCLNDAGYPAVAGDGAAIAVKGPANKAGRLVIERGVSAERKLGKMLRQRMDANGKTVRAVTLVLRTILKQSNLDGTRRGGLSGTATAMMVAAVAEKMVAPFPYTLYAADLLKEVLKVYSTWRWSACSITLGTFFSEAKTHEGAVSVCTPFDAKVNLAEGCTRAAQISAMFQYTSLALSQWSKQVSNAERNSRGVTPLSAVIAHKDLWDRSHMLRRVALADSDR